MRMLETCNATQGTRRAAEEMCTSWYGEDEFNNRDICVCVEVLPFVFFSSRSLIGASTGESSLRLSFMRYKPRLLLTALLGTPPGDSIHIKDNLWWISDFLFAHHLFKDEVESEQDWLTQLDVYEELEKLNTEIPTSPNLILHGPPQSERFVLPIPTSGARFYKRMPKLKSRFLETLANYGQDSRQEDHIVILLFGHGDPDKMTPGRVECGIDRHGNTCWLSSKEIEKALQKCKARHITLISTSCFAAKLANDRWSLFAAAELGELPPSASDRACGTSFGASPPKLVANAFNFTFHPSLAHLQPDQFTPPVPLESLRSLDGTSEPAKFPSTSDGYNLPFQNCGEAISRTRAAMHGSVPGSTDHSFHPSIPTNEQWDDWSRMIVIKSSIDFVLRTSELQQQAPNVDSTAAPTATAGAGRPNASNDDSPVDSSDEDSSDGDSGSDAEDETSAGRRMQPEDDETVIDAAQLTNTLTRWLHETRPLVLQTAARQSLMRHTQRHLAGIADTRETCALWRLFSTRIVADALAQRLAEELHIAHPEVQCVDFREVERLPACHGIELYSVDWGRLEPCDDTAVDRLAHPYRRAGQWVFASWARSGRDTGVLIELLNRVDGGIIVW